jgi:hypothetical protein
MDKSPGPIGEGSRIFVRGAVFLCRKNKIRMADHRGALAEESPE